MSKSWNNKAIVIFLKEIIFSVDVHFELLMASLKTKYMLIHFELVEYCNNISVISWWSVLLVEATRVPGENQRTVASQKYVYFLSKGI
jgi:hypothetical protein